MRNDGLSYYDPALCKVGDDFNELSAFLDARDPDSVGELALHFFTRLRNDPLTAGLTARQAATVAAGLVHQLMCGLGGSSLYIPSGYVNSVSRRKALALGMRAQGLSYRAVGHQLGLSEMRIRQYEAEQRKNAKKGDGATQ